MHWEQTVALGMVLEVTSYIAKGYMISVKNHMLRDFKNMVQKHASKMADQGYGYDQESVDSVKSFCEDVRHYNERILILPTPLDACYICYKNLKDLRRKDGKADE